MGKVFKINPWPFAKDEVVTLHWISSPKCTVARQWEITVNFLNASQVITSMQLPWGYVSTLRIGASYVNGKLIQPIEGFYGKLALPPDDEIQVCTADAIPAELYSTFFFPEYMKENVCTFSVSGMTYYLPCIDIVRMYLAPTAVLAHSLVSAAGLSQVLLSHRIVEAEMYLDLTSDYPRGLASEEYMLHLAWLIGTAENLHLWNRVRNHLVDHTIQNPATRALSCKPPALSHIVIQYRGIQKNNDCLIQSLFSLGGLMPPNIRHIHYSHPEFTLRKRNDEPRYKKVGVPPNRDHQSELSNSETEDPSGTVSTTKKAKGSTQSYRFIFKPKVNREVDTIKEVKGGPIHKQTVIADPPPNGPKEDNDEIFVTGREPGHGGNLPPVDFDLLERVPQNRAVGLEAFIRCMLSLKAADPTVQIYLSVFMLPAGYTFSSYPDGTRRQVAIVYIEQSSKYPAYIIEVGRPDHWKISTLVLQETGERHLKKTHLKELLTSILDHYGHWSEEALSALDSDFEIHLLRHRTAKHAFSAYRNVLRILFPEV